VCARVAVAKRAKMRPSAATSFACGDEPQAAPDMTGEMNQGAAKSAYI